MKENSPGRSPKPHPIQLVNLGVRELFIESHQAPDPNVGAVPEECSIQISSSPYDSSNKRLIVSLRLESGVKADPTKTPYAMRIELVGVFQVDDTQFSVEHVDDWARNGAPLVMFPFLREHAYSLSLRCGFRPMLLPLLDVPTFTTGKPRSRASRSKKT